MDSNLTVVSPLANAKVSGVVVPQNFDFVVDAVFRTSPWTVAFTVLAVLVAYDQSEFFPLLPLPCPPSRAPC